MKTNRLTRFIFFIIIQIFLLNSYCYVYAETLNENETTTEVNKETEETEVVEGVEEIEETEETDGVEETEDDYQEEFQKENPYIYDKEYELKDNRGPSMATTLTNKSNVIIKTNDGNNISKVVVYRWTMNKSKKCVWSNITSKVTISKDKKTVKIPKKFVANYNKYEKKANLYKNSKNVKFKIIATDNSTVKNYSENIIKITKLSKKTKGNYFSVKMMPTFSFVKIPCLNKNSIDKIIIKTNSNKITKYSISDCNQNKTYTKTVNKESNITITYPLKNLKLSSANTYNFVVTLTDTEGCSHKEKLFVYIGTQKKTNKNLYVAHRGDNFSNPENTVKSFKEAAKKGAYGIETDLQLTKDGELVCVHDKSLNRTTDAEGYIADYTLAQLKEVNIVDETIKERGSVKIPTFEEYLNICKEYNENAIIELKINTKVDNNLYVNTMIKKLNETGMNLNKCTIISFDKELLELVREKNKTIKLGYLSKDKKLTTLNEAANYCVKLKNCDLMVNYKYVTRDVVNYAHSKKLKVCAYTADGYEVCTKLKDMGVDYITTNRIDL